jgi:acyl-CoA thioesterase
MCASIPRSRDVREVKFAPPGPLAELLGIHPISFGESAATFGRTGRDDHLNPYGVVHGGVIYSLVDTAMGAAVHTRLAQGERCATIEIKINYLAPVTAGDLAAEARLVERTKRIAVLEARVRSDGGQLVAVATGTFYIQQPG